MARGDRDGVLSHPAAGPLAFSAFLAAGCLYIVTAKLWGIGAGWVTGVPVMLMAAYAATLLLAPSARLRDDQAGDNVYYMGFLYTLTSLGVSLYQFGDADSGTAIVRNFGIAVASTIAGVAGRVLFAQMRRDPVEVERSARMELAEAARRVRRELDGSVVEFGFFRRQMQQMVEEGLAETRGSLDKAWEEARDGMAKAAAAASASVADAALSLSAGVDAHASAVAAHAAFLEAQAAEGAAATRQSGSELAEGARAVAAAARALEAAADRLAAPGTGSLVVPFPREGAA